MPDLDRTALLELTPEVYLAEGLRGPDGASRPELRDTYATAAATQLLAAEVSPQELGFLIDAIRELLPLHDEADPAERLQATLREATEVVARMIRQPLNERARLWLYECADAVENEADLKSYQEHLDAVMRQYGTMVALVTGMPGASTQAAH